MQIPNRKIIQGNIKPWLSGVIPCISLLIYVL